MFTPDYTIQLPTGEKIDLLFNTYFYKSFAAKKGWELDDLLKNVQAMLSGGNGFSTSDIPLILSTAHETWCKYNRLPFTADELEVCRWQDAMGGLVQGLGAYAEVMKIFIARLLNIDPAGLKTEVEKKSEEEAKNPESV